MRRSLRSDGQLRGPSEGTCLPEVRQYGRQAGDFALLRSPTQILLGEVIYAFGLPSKAAAGDNRLAGGTPDGGGRGTRNGLPLPTSLFSRLGEPPWRSASSRLMKRPSPVPG